MAHAQHTPGPWETIKRCTGFYDIGIPEKHREVGKPHWIATVWERDEKHATNARLIAAAPELVEALLGVIDCAGLTALPGYRPELDQAVSNARALLARIKGEAV